MDTTTWRALAEPNRLQIVELLREGPLTVGEIAKRLQFRQPQASKHLRALSEAGIVKARVEANRRVYQLQSGPFIRLDSWLASYRENWEDSFTDLDDYLKGMQDKTEK